VTVQAVGSIASATNALAQDVTQQQTLSREAKNCGPGWVVPPVKQASRLRIQPLPVLLLAVRPPLARPQKCRHCWPRTHHPPPTENMDMLM